MDKILYSQVLITCTTINVISIISMFGVMIADKLHDRREKKKKEREEKAAKDAETKAERVLRGWASAYGWCPFSDWRNYEFYQY